MKGADVRVQPQVINVTSRAIKATLYYTCSTSVYVAVLRTAASPFEFSDAPEAAAAPSRGVLFHVGLVPEVGQKKARMFL